MPDFSNGVATPGGASFMAPPMNFANIANWFKDYQQGVLGNQQQQQNDQSLATGQQQQTLNDQMIAQGKQKAALTSAFPNGLPTDPKTGAIDYGKVAATLAKFGDVGDAVTLLQQQAPPMSPLLAGGGQPGQPGAAAGPNPSSVPAKPLPPPAANSPKGDSGAGTVTSLVTDRLPSQNQTTGEAIMKIAEVMGVDPNANLTPGQVRRAQGLLNKYAPDVAGVNTGGGGGSLPPSANAGTPSPGANSPPASGQPAPQGAPGGAPAPPQGAGGQPQQTQTGGAITPQVPLPKGFTDPQEAILALRAEAARVRQNQRGAPQATALNEWATKIEASIAPVDVNQNTTRLDPRNGKILYQGPAAAAYAATGTGSSLDADAARYRQTGTLPPNMGRGAQGEAEAKAIRAKAVQQEIEAGGDPGNWPSRWQDFKAAGVGKSAGERVKANREENLNLILKAADAAIPAALEASKALPRGDYVPLNKLIQKGEIMSSDPRLVEFGMANLQLAEHWARAMNPTGVMRESDRDKALTFLDTAYGNSTYERAVMQLQKQITRERDAVRGGGTILKNSKAPDPSEDVKSKEWVRGPDGKLGPAQ